MGQYLKHCISFFLFTFFGQAGAQVPDTLLAHKNFEAGIALQEASEYAAADSLFLMAEQLYFTAKNFEKYLACKNQRCANLIDTYKPEKATMLANEIITESKTYLEKNNLEEAQAYHSLARVLMQKGQYKAAIDSNKLALKIRLSKLPADHLLLANSYNNEGRLYNKTGEQEKALIAHNKAYTIRVKNLGEKHPKVASSLTNIGNSYQYSGDYNQVLKYYEEALEINTAHYGTEHKTIALNNNNIGTFYYRKGNYDLAIDFYLKALHILEAISDKPTPPLAGYCRNIGSCYYYKGMLDEAIGYFNKSLKISTDLFGEEHPSVSSSLNALGAIYISQKEHKAAIRHFEKAIGLRINSQDSSSYLTSIIYKNKGYAYHMEEDFQQAKLFYNKAFTIRKQILDSNHLAIAESHSDLGHIHFEEGKTDSAILAYNQSLAIQKHKLGEKNYMLAENYNNLAKAWYHKDDLEQSLEYCEAALSVNPFNWQDDFSLFSVSSIKKTYAVHDHLESLHIKALIARRQFEKYDTLDKLLEAQYTFRQCDTLIGKIYKAYLSRANKLNFDKSAAIYQNALACSHALFQATGNHMHLKQAFYFAEKMKANILLQDIAADHPMALGGLPPEDIKREKALRQDVAVYQSLVEKFKAEGKDSLLTQYRDHYALNTRKELEKLIRKIKNNYPEYYKLKYDYPISTPEEIQSLLNDTTLLLSYSLVEQKHKKPEDRKPRLYIFLLSSNEIKLVTTAWHPETYNNITTLHNMASSSSSRIEQLQQKFIKINHALYQQFIAPVATDLAEMKRLIVIRENEMAYLPFELLLKNNESKPFRQMDFLVRDYEISYHFAATSYWHSMMKKQNFAANNILLFAPVFKDNNPATGRSYALDYLPGSEKEVREIGTLFNKKPGVKITSLLHEQATETALKTSFGEPHDIIHLATHSFANLKDFGYKNGIACYPWIEQNGNKNTDDAILFMLEIYNLKLKADLVVMSSCESGLGKIVKGEGMLGLNRSIFQAGVPNILYTLWNIDDVGSSNFMIEFYRNLLAEKNYAKALRQTKLSFLKDEETAKPMYWSSFLLLGN